MIEIEVHFLGLTDRNTDNLTPGLPARDVLLALFVVREGLLDPREVQRQVLACLGDPRSSLGEVLLHNGQLTRQEHSGLMERVEAVLSDRVDTMVSEGPSGVQLLTGQEELKRLVTEDPERYSNRRLHARGGQGKIIRAFDQFIGRQVAIKEFVPDRSDETTAGSERSMGLVRFLREARITGQLEHPNIVPVHELGRRPDGTFYYAMRLVRGETLAKRLARSGDLADRLKLLGPFWDVCNAIAFAHQNGVVHRDIKPSNIMVGELGETVLLDWGVAKIRGETDTRLSEIQRNLGRLRAGDQDRTLDGATLGTPAYMSPEQAQGEVDQIDERSDVWSLGAMLYEILTGCSPFYHEFAGEILVRVVEQNHPPVRQLCPEAPLELAAVVDRALQKNPELRYQDARELAGEIASYMTGGKVRAYDYSSWELLKRFASKNKAMVMAGGLVAVVVLVALVLVWVAYRNEASERLQKQQALAAEHTQRLNASFHLSQALARQSKLLFEKKNMLASRIYAAASLVNNPASPGSPFHDPDFAGSRPEAVRLVTEAGSLACLNDLRPVRQIGPVMHTPGATLRLAVSPDGSRLAATDYLGHLVIVDATDGRELTRKRIHQGRVWGLAWSADGGQLATGGQDHKLVLTETSGWTTLRTIPVDKEISVIHYAPDGKRLACAGAGKRVDIFNPATGEKRASAGMPHLVRSLAFSRDGSLLAAGDKSGLIHLLDGNRLKTRAVLRGHGDRVMGVAFSPDDRHLLSASFDKTVRYWEIATRKMVHVLGAHQEVVRSVVFLPGTFLAASASDDRQVHILDPAAGDVLMRLEGHPESVNTLAADPRGRYLASAGWDKSIRLWLLDVQALPRRFSAPSNLFGMSLAPDGGQIAVTSDRYTTRLWELQSGRIRTVRGSRANGAILLQDGRTLATLENDGSLKLWDRESLELVREWKAHEGPVMFLDQSPDGHLLASSGQDGEVRLWESATGQPAGRPTGHQRMAISLDFSPDGRLLAAGSMDKTIRIWETSTASQLARLEDHQDWVLWLEFSPDGKHLVSAGKDARVIVWKVDGWKQAGRLRGHETVVSTVAFSPDGRLLATGSYDNSARVWDFKSRREQMRIFTRGAVVDLEFTPQGKELAVVAYHNVVLYPLADPDRAGDPAKLLKLAQKQAGTRLEGFDLRPATDQNRQ